MAAISIRRAVHHRPQLLPGKVLHLFLLVLSLLSRAQQRQATPHHMAMDMRRIRRIISKSPAWMVVDRMKRGLSTLERTGRRLLT